MRANEVNRIINQSLTQRKNKSGGIRTEYEETRSRDIPQGRFREKIMYMSFMF